MASTVYYGKSTTRGNEAIKKVYLTDSSVTANTLQEGDLLVVYFAYGLEVDSPSLALYIGDANEEISVSENSGKVIYNTGSIHAQAGDWTNGEVVTFSYTTNKGIVENPDDTYYWEMVATVRATEENYGRVILDVDDAAAATVGKVKELINVSSNGRLSYNTTFTGDRSEVGVLTLTNIDAEGQEMEGQSVTIYIPKNDAVIPTSLADFASSNQLPFNNATQLGYITEEEGIDTFNRIIDLDAGAEHNVHVFSPNNIYLNPEVNNGKVIIGAEGYGNKLDVRGELTVGSNAHIIGDLTTNKVITNGIVMPINEGDVSQINAPETPTNLGDTIVKSINVRGNATINGTTTFNGPIVGLPSANLGATSVTSLNIGNQTLANYIDSRIPAYKDPTTGLIVTQTITSGNFSLAPGKYYKTGETIGVYVGNFAKTGYTILGVLNWTVGIGESGTNVHFASVYGLWWSGTHLYCKVYNVGNANITNANIAATVLYRKI